MPAENQPYGLMFRAARRANDLREGEIAVLDGHVIGVTTDSDDPELVRLTLVRALGPPPGTNPDLRPIEVVCPRDMLFGTAEPHNLDLARPPTRS
jgi:hypothetical protein